MQFGQVQRIDGIDFSLPVIDLSERFPVKETTNSTRIYVGVPRWAKADLKGFYPRGVKDELVYYAKQFNCVELNATFYTIFGADVVRGWYDKTPADFRFYPKVFQGISHWKRLKDTRTYLEDYLNSIAHLEDKLGACFLQMPENFSPSHWSDLALFLQQWPTGFPLAIELRHPAWFDGTWDNAPLKNLLRIKNISLIITDVPARRDLLHLDLLTPQVLIRFNSCDNREKDIERLKEWAYVIGKWRLQGVQEVAFFVHQRYDVLPFWLAPVLIEALNKIEGVYLKPPVLQGFQETLPF